jgi:hypothetical protein
MRGLSALGTSMLTRQNGEAGGASVCRSIHINLFKSQTTLLDKLKKIF